MSEIATLQKAADEARKGARAARELGGFLDNYAKYLSQRDGRGRADEMRGSGVIVCCCCPKKRGTKRLHAPLADDKSDDNAANCSQDEDRSVCLCNDGIRQTKQDAEDQSARPTW